ncbi:YHS domain-containing protein [Desulfohalobiaceae bacterium Ax17]|jgi:YHS domain-containing protein|uniref:transcriptional regulator n=1 Tax=Desulfovulcanus ferrireducens TaxID=2831190 RepID=UPI00207BA141|nr:transcriptional regulator [Desulfovulcanus ferrireducens]MBT8763149.1 YHS domain-containing protein [Desulfovulcanus ferrireducens]
MIKLLIFVVAGYFLFKLLTNDKKKKKEMQEKKKENLAANGIMVKDPICGTYVPKDGDIRVRQGENVYHFCCYECRDKFLKQIEQG